MITFVFPNQVSRLALLHGLRPDWRPEAPGIAKALGLTVPPNPCPYLAEWLAGHPLITNREVLHPKPIPANTNHGEL